MIPACPSFMCFFFNRGDTEETNSSKSLCSRFVYVLFYVNLCQDWICGLWIVCTNQVVSITCGNPGHKRGDELCPLSDRPAQQTTPTPSPSAPSPPPDQAPEMDSASHSASTLTPQAEAARKTIQPSIRFQRAKSASSKRQRTRSPPTADSERSPNSKRLSRAEAFFESMRAKSTKKHNADTGQRQDGEADCDTTWWKAWRSGLTALIMTPALPMDSWLWKLRYNHNLLLWRKN